MRRREFVTLVGGALAASSSMARAQQRAMPASGFLISASAEGYASMLIPVREGLKEAGYREGENLTIEYRWADYHYDRLPALATDLVSRQVAVIFATGSVVSAVAAQSATSAIPIVFVHGSDPVRYGLVASLNRPGGNVTGMTLYNGGLGPKRIELIRDMVPRATTIGLLVNPNNPNASDDGKEIQEAGRGVGIRVEIVNAGSEHDFDEAFAKIREVRADALMVHIDALFNAQYKKIVTLAEQYAVPAIYPNRQAAVGGGLMSYGTDSGAIFRQAGIYIGKILKGAKPADLPVLQPTKFELIINLKTSKALGLTIPDKMLALADEVIE
jgi:putative tryptophan/tyrosine transport system substrate-binding protein